MWERCELYSLHLMPGLGIVCILFSLSSQYLQSESGEGLVVNMMYI